MNRQTVSRKQNRPALAPNAGCWTGTVRAQESTRASTRASARGLVPALSALCSRAISIRPIAVRP